MDKEERALEMLTKLRARLEDIGDPMTKPKKTNDNANIGAECVCCLLPIEKGMHFIRMPCCGAFCHLWCIVRIAKSHQLFMSHACPHCQKELSPEQEQMFVKMYPILHPLQNEE